jgi:hypothetical protein
LFATFQLSWRAFFKRMKSYLQCADYKQIGDREQQREVNGKIIDQFRIGGGRGQVGVNLQAVSIQCTCADALTRWVSQCRSVKRECSAKLPKGLTHPIY